MGTAIATTPQNNTTDAAPAQGRGLTIVSPARRVPKNFVELREGNTPDGRDGNRRTLVLSAWDDQTDLLRHRDRQIEENIRMLAGQQWSMYHPLLGRWLDVTEWMDDDERRWRQRPVFNRLLPWFIITHARATESQPIVTFVPGPDRVDAELAEALDIANKSLWTEMGMVDANDRLMGWVIAAGRAHLQVRLDPNGGEVRTWMGSDLIPVVDQYDRPVSDNDGGQLHHMAEGVPFDHQGNPLAVWRQFSGDPNAGELVVKGEPHTEREGRLVPDVFSPLEVRGQWGPQPWHQKAMHVTKQYLTPEQVYDLWGVDVAPTVRGSASTIGELERVLFGTGFFGAHDARLANQAALTSTDGYVEITTRWQAPCSYGGMEQTETSPGGRYTVVTPNEVICDGVRPVAFPYTSPIRCFDFVRLPGRPSGTSPIEPMTPVQRSYNRGHAQIQEHVNLSTNPKAMIDQASGIKAGEFTNEPGDNYVVNRRQGVPAVEYVAPPQLSPDVYKHMQMLVEELTTMGSLQGTDGEPVIGESGEAIKERRFNSDRFLGPTLRRAVEEYARFIEDIQAMLPVIWDQQKLITYMGEDDIARTVTVMPYMFQEGHVHVRPDVESMLPEGRGERQARVYQMWKDGAFGLPLSPDALRWFHELARFPNMARTAQPGGVDRQTASQFVGRLLMGADPTTLPTYDWYDLGVHATVLEDFMKSPAFLRQTPAIQSAFVYRRQVLQFALQRRQLQAAQQQAALASAATPGGPGGPGAPGGAPGGGNQAPVAMPGAETVAPGPPNPPKRDIVPGGVMPTNIPSPAQLGASNG